MDPAAREAWENVLRADDAFYEAVGKLAEFPLGDILIEALGEFRGQRTALKLLHNTSVEIRHAALPALFPLALVSHSLLLEVRRVITSLPREILDQELPPLVTAVLYDESSDYEAYRRLAELLRETGHTDLLRQLVAAARRSKDEDILEVADDFEEATYHRS